MKPDALRGRGGEVQITSLLGHFFEGGRTQLLIKILVGGEDPVAYKKIREVGGGPSCL